VFEVYESASREALDGGQITGRWRLGCVGGECGGALEWLRSEQHVVELLGEDPELPEDLWRPSADVAPWCRFQVGAAKKAAAKSKSAAAADKTYTEAF
jgi:hypothetical protein